MWKKYAPNCSNIFYYEIFLFFTGVLEFLSRPHIYTLFISPPEIEMDGTKLKLHCMKHNHVFIESIDV